MGRNPESRSRRLLKKTSYATSAFAALGVGTVAVSIANAESRPIPAYASPFPEGNMASPLSADDAKPSTTITIFDKNREPSTTSATSETKPTTIPKTTTTTRSTSQPTEAASGGDIPANYLANYRRSGNTCAGLNWSILAAIGKLETDHGRHPGTYTPNSHGALGPMQFLPSTWEAYKADGNNDGVKNILEPGDAVAGAANYLCDSGLAEPSKTTSNPCPSVNNGTLGEIKAIHSYNRSCRYVSEILKLAGEYSKQYTA